MSSVSPKHFNIENEEVWNSSYSTEQRKHLNSILNDGCKSVWRDEDARFSHHITDPSRAQAAGSGCSLLSTFSMVDRPVYTCVRNINIDKTHQKEPFAFQKQARSLSTFQNLIESSWMSACLHRSILALGIKEVVAFAKPQACGFSTSGSLLGSPKIPLPIGGPPHNSLPLGGLMHAHGKHELQLTNSHKMFQGSNVPGVLPVENNMGHAHLYRSGLPGPICSSKPSSNEEMHATRLVGAHKLALHGQANKTTIAHSESLLERLQMKENLSQTDPEGSRTCENRNCAQKEPRQKDAPRRSDENQTGEASRRTAQWCLDCHRPPFDQGCSPPFVRKDTFQASSRHGRSSSGAHPSGVPTKQDPFSSPNQQLHESPTESTTDEKVADRFQALYRFRLLLRCFKRWSAGLRSLSKARLYYQRRILSKALFALQRAVLLHRAQADTAEDRQNAVMLALAFHRWKDVYEGRQLVRLNPSSCTEGRIAALRKRLVQASDALPLRLTRCVWIHGQRIHRAAVIHHHLSVLCKHWLLWRQAWLKQISRAQQEQQAGVWREQRLRSSAWTTWQCVWQKRQRSTHLHRLFLQRWHRYAQRARLLRLTQAVERLLSIRTLSAAFRTWKRAKEMRETLQRLYHQQDRTKLQAGFGKWLHGLRMKNLQERIQKACLARVFSAWTMLFQRRTRLELFWRRQNTLAARSFLQQWRRALELRSLQKRLLIISFSKRQQMFQRTSTGETVDGTVEFYGPEYQYSVEELCARLVLQTSVSCWRERLKKQQLAKWYHTVCVRERLRSGLTAWHRLAQAEVSYRVLKFRTRLAKCPAPFFTGLNPSGLRHFLNYTDPAGQEDALEMHCTNQSELTVFCSRSLAERDQRCPLQASSPLGKHKTQRYEAEESEDAENFSYTHRSCPQHCRGEVIALRVLMRMMQPDLSLAFSQWRAVLHSSRQMKCQADQFLNRRRLAGLKLAFSTWRTHTKTQRKAVQHRERVLLCHSLTAWRRLMWCRFREHYLQQQAIHFHQARIIKNCFSAWHRQAVPVQASGLERMEWRVKRRRLHWAFSSWAARGRQQKAASALCTRALLRRVFAAFKKRVRCHKERQAVALSFVQHRLCSAAFLQWRSSWAQQQLADSRAEHTLCLSAKHMLQCWREYTHNRGRMHVHLCAFVEWKERALKRRAVLTWQEAVEKVKRARHFYQNRLLCRCFLKWLSVSERNRELKCVLQDLQEVRAQRLQQRTFSQWNLWFIHIQSEKQRLRMLVGRWMAFSRSRRAARRREQHLLTFSLQLWRRKLGIKRKRKEAALVALGIWRRRVLLGRAEREWVLNVQKPQQNHAFLYWARAARLSFRSREHHAAKQRKRVLQAWHIHTVSAQRMRYSEACLQYSIELRVTGSCFSLWRTALCQAQSQQRVLEERLRLHHSKLTSQIFQNWRAATIQHSAVKKINTALLQKWFVCWTRQRDALRTANQFHAQTQKEEARLVLTAWSLWAKEQKGCRQMEEAVRLWLEGRRVRTFFHQWHKVYRQNQVALFHYHMCLLHRVLWAWRAAALQTQQERQTAEGWLRRVQIQSAFTTWKQAAVSHKAEKLLRAVLQAWHQETQARKQDLHLSEKYFSLWTREMQRRQSERRLQDRCRAKWLRRWRYRAVEQREQRDLTHLYWASWKSQTAASLLYSQQNEHGVLQRAWLTWRKRCIRNRVAAAHTASLNRVLLLKAFRLWWRRALALGLLPSRAPTRSHSL